MTLAAGPRVLRRMARNSDGGNWVVSSLKAGSGAADFGEGMVRLPLECYDTAA